MWLPKSLIELFQVSKDTVDALRTDLNTVRAERDILKVQLGISQNQFSWLSQRVNILEVERAQLLQKAYGIQAPIPEIVRVPNAELDLHADLFNHIDDEMAKQYGFTV